MTSSPSDSTFAVLPDPGQAGSLGELLGRLKALRTWAGEPSFAVITDRVNALWRAAGRPANELTTRSTVVDCFRPDRRRVNTDLVIAVVEALHPDTGYVAQWHQALRVIGGEVGAASQIRVQDTLPPDLAGFTGRGGELDQIRQALHAGQADGGAVVISAISGMAGVGKTQLAVHAGHLLNRESPFNRVLFVNLRGFQPGQPPADPAAVLDGFLRLLGVPGQQIPHEMRARTSAYRERLAGTRTLVLLDNAVDTEQVRPLLPTTAGCLALVTSRRSLAGLHPAIHLTVDVFTADEATGFLGLALPEAAVGPDPLAAARIAERCGYLPLALGLVAGHIRGKSGWTLTDHAERLDERHRHRHLETGVELALDLSYQHLPEAQQRLLRLAALHPGHDFDVYAAAALTGAPLPATEEALGQLRRDHLLQEAAEGRFSFHDLVRDYGASRASDQDPPAQRQTALTQLFDYYLGTAAAAMDVAYPHEQQRRPSAPPSSGPAPDLAAPDRAERWLDTELANLLAVAQHAAAHDWPEHCWQLAAILHRHLRIRGHHHDAETLHQQALGVARDLGNQPAEVHALNGLGYVDRMLGRHEQAGDRYGQARRIAQAIGDRSGEVDALYGLGYVHWRQGDYEQATGHFELSLRVAQTIGDRNGELNALTGLGDVDWMSGSYEHSAAQFEQALRIAQDLGHRPGELRAHTGIGGVDRMLGRHENAADHFSQALRIAQAIGDRSGERNALTNLGHVHRMVGRHEQAGEDYREALRIAQAIGNRVGEMTVLTSLGDVHRMLGRHTDAADCYQQVFDLACELGSSNWQFEALQGLGRLHHAAGQSDLALTYHQQALDHATDLRQPPDEARAHDGLAHAYRAVGQPDLARKHWQHALDILTGLGADHTEDTEASVPAIRAHLAQADL